MTSQINFDIMKLRKMCYKLHKWISPLKINFHLKRVRNFLIFILLCQNRFFQLVIELFEPILLNPN